MLVLSNLLFGFAPTLQNDLDLLKDFLVNEWFVSVELSLAGVSDG
jgi:hypothetical protein